MKMSPTRVLAGPRPSRNSIDQLAAQLQRSLGIDRVLRSSEILQSYSEDKSGFGSFLPDLVVRPRNADEVSRVLAEASRLAVPVVPRGGGTGRVGGALPVQGGVVLSLEEMNRVVSIDRDNFVAKAEPGVILQNFQNAVEEAGLFYPPDPSSLDVCSLGGTVACNAGGPRALKYGVTANYVLGAQVVLASGEILETGRNTVKGGAGYDLHRLIVGSEGTLGIITQLTFRLMGRPIQVETALVTFPDSHSAIRACVKVSQTGLVPRSMEFMDRTALGVARKRAPEYLPADAGACLIIELDGFDGDPLKQQLSQIGDLCRAEGAQQVILAASERERRELWAARRELSPALKESAPCKVSEDIVVPRAKLAHIVERLETIAADQGVTIAAFGHAGDGNLHCNVLFDEDHRSGADEACLSILKLAVEAGGTLAGEHGTGVQKVDVLSLEQSSQLIDFQCRLKRLFDPAGILNPGKVVRAGMASCGSLS